MSRSLVCLFFVCLLSCINVFASGQIYVKADSFEINLDEGAEFWSENNLVKNINADDFLISPPPSQKKEELSYADHTIWTKVSLVTDPLLSAEDWLLVMTPRDHHFSVTLFDEQNIAVNNYLKSKEDAKAQISLKLKKGARYTLIIKSINSNFLNFKLIQAAFYEGQLQKKDLYYGFFFGALAVLLLYSFFIFYVIKEFSYLFYSFYLLGCILVIEILGGQLALNEYLTSIALLASVFFILFSHQMLKLDQYYFFLRKNFFLVIGIGVVLAVFAAFSDFVPFSALIEIAGDLYMVGSLTTMLVFAFILASKGVKSAKIYMAAWTPLFFVLVLYLLRCHFFKSLPAYVDVVGFYISILIQTLIFTAAFTFKMRELQIDHALQLEKAKDIDRLRSLIRIICHDIVNPLTIIIAHANIKKEMGDSVWSAVTRASEKIYDLVTRVKTLQAIESGKQVLTFSTVTVGSIVHELHETFYARFKEKEIDFLLEVHSIVMAKKIVVDSVLFENSVMNNLFSNAIKFSYPHSLIKLVVYEEGERICFELSDQGIGIPQKVLKNIFSPFEKTSRPGTKGEKGTGFGMPLVKTIIEGMGGEIVICSSTVEENPELTHGSTQVKVFVKKV